MKTAIRVLTVTTALVLLTGCTNKADDQPKTPIFAGTAEITLILPIHATGTVSAGGSFTYSVPAEVKYIVFGLFNAEIVTSGKTITNPAAFVAGSRDQLSDFVRGNQARSALHAYNQATKDFNSTASGAVNGSYYWAVWGYDQYGNLTHSSPQRLVTLN